MSNPVGWLQILRSTLELLYFASGITIAIAAVWGLQQLRITRQIARINAMREALKFAAERCQYFADRAVPAGTGVAQEYKRLGLKFLGMQNKWSIQNGEIVNHNFDPKLIGAEFQKITPVLINHLNVLEAFAIPFAASVADDNLGYQETAIAFCQRVRIYMPAYFYLRRIGDARFESTIKLFDRWNKRLTAKKIESDIKPMQEFLRSVESEKIKPLGTED